VTIRVFGQVAPAVANTPNDLYTVPVGKFFVASMLAICNRGTNSKCSIAIRPNGAALANQHWVYFDFPISSGGTLEGLKGMTLNAGDVITVQGASTNFGFTLFGEES
jgi:hypothetical protein